MTEGPRVLVPTIEVDYEESADVTHVVVTVKEPRDHKVWRKIIQVGGEKNAEDFKAVPLLDQAPDGPIWLSLTTQGGEVVVFSTQMELMHPRLELGIIFTTATGFEPADERIAMACLPGDQIVFATIRSGRLSTGFCTLAQWLEWVKPASRVSHMVFGEGPCRIWNGWGLR